MAAVMYHPTRSQRHFEQQRLTSRPQHDAWTVGITPTVPQYPNTNIHSNSNNTTPFSSSTSIGSTIAPPHTNSSYYQQPAASSDTAPAISSGSIRKRRHENDNGERVTDHYERPTKQSKRTADMMKSSIATPASILLSSKRHHPNGATEDIEDDAGNTFLNERRKRRQTSSPPLHSSSPLRSPSPSSSDISMDDTTDTDNKDTADHPRLGHKEFEVEADEEQIENNKIDVSYPPSHLFSDHNTLHAVVPLPSYPKALLAMYRNANRQQHRGRSQENDHDDANKQLVLYQPPVTTQELIKTAMSTPTITNESSQIPSMVHNKPQQTSISLHTTIPVSSNIKSTDMPASPTMTDDPLSPRNKSIDSSSSSASVVAAPHTDIHPNYSSSISLTPFQPRQPSATAHLYRWEANPTPQLRH